MSLYDINEFLSEAVVSLVKKYSDNEDRLDKVDRYFKEEVQPLIRKGIKRAIDNRSKGYRVIDPGREPYKDSNWMTAKVKVPDSIKGKTSLVSITFAISHWTWETGSAHLQNDTGYERSSVGIELTGNPSRDAAKLLGRLKKEFPKYAAEIKKQGRKRSA